MLRRELPLNAAYTTACGDNGIGVMDGATTTLAVSEPGMMDSAPPPDPTDSVGVGTVVSMGSRVASAAR